MPVKAYDVNTTTINLPSFNNEEWIAEIQQSSGIMHDIRRIQYSALLLTKKMKDNRVSIDRLAWFNIWTREMHILEALTAAYDYKTEYLLKVLNRISFELMLQVMTILDPLSNMGKKDASSKSETRDVLDDTQKAKLAERMRAYTAWCLLNDLFYLKDLTNPMTLKHIWDPEPARSIKSDPEEYAKYAAYFGSIDNEIDERELKKWFLKQQDREMHRRRRIEAWLDHPDLTKWKTKLERLAKSGNPSPSFFSLFNETERSICSRLRSLNLRFMYVDYIQSSLFIHGSSIETNLLFHENSFTPRTMNDRESVADITKSILSECMSILMGLKILQSALWEQRE